MKGVDRRFLFTTGAAAALLASTGVPAHALPKRGGRLVAALSGADRADSWAQGAGVFITAARGAVFETLTEIAADGSLRGDIALGWSSADGGLTWVFEIDPDVVFHDGKRITQADFAALFARHPDLDVRDVSRPMRGYLAVRLNVANPNFPYRMASPAFVVLPADPVRQAQGIGTGLYRVQKFQTGRQFIGTRLAKHRKDGSGGWFDQVELVSIPSGQVRAEALRDGLIDVADDVKLDGFTDPRDFQALPSDHTPQQFAHISIGVPATIGQIWALDNMRMATRWWAI